MKRQTALRSASRLNGCRSAFTLVELLVVISIMVALAGVVALVAPRFNERSRVAEASRQLTSWLGVSQQRAMRDKAPRGVRFVSKLPSSVQQVNDHWNTFVYIEQPEDITGQPAEILPPQMALVQVSAFRNGFQGAVTNALRAAASAATDPVQRQKYLNYAAVIQPPLAGTNDGWKYLLWINNRNLVNAVKENDVVEFGGARYTLIYQPVLRNAAANDCILVLHRMRDEFRQSPTVPPVPLPAYRITRAAQPIAGEPELTLPRNTAVDIQFTNLAQNKTATRSLPAPDVNTPASSLNIDILFGPSGELVGGLGTYGRVVLWLRDVTLTDSAPDLIPEGENRLVVLHSRTGQIATHAINPDVRTAPYPRLIDPYRFVRDGKSSGLEDE